jgi:Mlc titration factor MtfA (ptsG expression regulator)
MFDFVRRRRRKNWLREPLPEEYPDFLRNEVPYYNRLEPVERDLLHGHMRILLEEKHFEAVDGLPLTWEMKCTIASQAAVLLLGKDMDYYPRLQSIVVYPDTFSSTIHQQHGGGVVTEEDVSRVGESWQLGTVLLSWKQVLNDTQLNSSRHVVFHEFAHQIDQADGLADGWPGALAADQEAAWAQVMAQEYQGLRTLVEEGGASVLDPYGATKPTEFFATLTEIFFMRPRLLQEHHSALYDLLKGFYGQDPRRRFSDQ